MRVVGAKEVLEVLEVLLLQRDCFVKAARVVVGNCEVVA